MTAAYQQVLSAAPCGSTRVQPHVPTSVALAQLRNEAPQDVSLAWLLGHLKWPKRSAHSGSSCFSWHWLDWCRGWEYSSAPAGEVDIHKWLIELRIRSPSLTHCITFGRAPCTVFPFPAHLRGIHMLRMPITTAFVVLSASAFGQFMEPVKDIKFGAGCVGPVSTFAARLGACTINDSKSRIWCPEITNASLHLTWSGRSAG